ncbi:hypothetical protein [Pantoea septica]|nr:hypothetical protein [Pantoea septica]
MFTVKSSLFPLFLLIFGLLPAALVRAECQIQLSDAQVAFSPVTRAELLGYPGNSLASVELSFGEPRSLDITVMCDRPAELALAFNGAAKDSESYLFGDNGRATLKLQAVSVDGQPVLIESDGKREAEMNFTPGHILRFWQNGTPVTGRTLRGSITASIWIPSPASRVNERKSWELSGAFVLGSAS